MTVIDDGMFLIMYCMFVMFFFFSSRRRHTRSVSAFLLNRSSDLRQNLFQELDAVIHLLMEAKHWGLRKSRNATSLNSRFKSLDTLKVKIISVTFRRVIRTNHKKASKIWRHENIQLGGCQSRSEERFSRNAETDLVCRLLLEKKKE